MDVVPLLRGRFGRPYTFVERCTSTQRLLEGAGEGAVAAADEQTEGRGRLGRGWHAPAGTSLLFSIVLVPPVPPERLPELSLVAGCAVAAAIAAEPRLVPALQYPNDVVLGVGVNVRQSEDELPPGVPATSLRLAGATNVDRADLLATVLERLEARYDTWVSDAGT